jgi:hypothetical protein
MMFMVAGGSEKMRIASSGNVGIGTSAPAAKLHVYHNTTGEYAAIIDQDEPNAGHGLKVTSDGNGAGSNILEVESGSTSLFRVKGDGKVGIGTTSPGALLDVNNSAYFYSSGNVAFGADYDYHPLSVRSSSDGGSTTLFIANTFVDTDSLDETTTLGFGFNAGAASIIVGKEEDYMSGANRSAYMSFEVRKNGSMAEKMRIDSSGNVGIGTDAPSQKLSITAGNLVLDDGQGVYWTNSNNRILISDSS